MFHSATIRLTLWYLALVMLISLAFSAALYRLTTHELSNRLHHQSVLLRGAIPYHLPPPVIDAELQVGAHNILTQLIFFNSIVLVVAGGAGYLLARRTLRPIEAAHIAQKRFTADASHELRTPLAAMHTEIEVALRDPHLPPADAKALLGSNLEEVKKLEALASALIDLAQYEEKHPTLNQPCNAQTIAHDATARVAKSAAERHITINQQLADATIKGDPVALTQLLVILLDNAIKYSPQQSSIEIKEEVQPQHLTITISDHGQGIDEADLPHVFDRFYRADPSRSKIKADGFGLGLPLARLIAKHHGGTVELKSTPGKGTTATVIVPR